MNISLKNIVLVLISALLISCNTIQRENKKAVIAISKASPIHKYQKYVDWLHYGDTTILWLDMYEIGIDSALKVLKNCNGLLLTGGEDINPELYGLEFDSALVDKPNTYRDSLENQLLEKAIELNMPVMGICRGMQMINVTLGGTLYFDLPTSLGTGNLHRGPGYKPVYHRVAINNKTILTEISGVDSGQVYSNHHQGIDKLADELIKIAHSRDGLIESVQYKNAEEKSFLIGVQWHPEKMDFKNPLSGNISKEFIKNVWEYNVHK